MELTPAALSSFFDQVAFAYQQGYLAARPASFWARLATQVPSGTEANVYPYLAKMPGFREWKGARWINNASLRSYTLANKDFEFTVGVNANKIKDDQFGFYKPMFEQAGAEKAIFPDRMVAKTIEDGTTTLCADGQYFFDTDHPVDADDSSKGTQANKLVDASYDLAVTDPTVPYSKARAAMAKWKMEDGEPAGIVPDTLICGEELRPYALIVAKAGLIARVVTNVAADQNVGGAGVSNVLVNEVDPISTPLLKVTSGRPWYLACTKLPIKPLIRQTREATGLIQMIDPTSPNVFHDNQYLYGEHIREAFGYGPPMLMFRMTAS